MRRRGRRRASRGRKIIDSLQETLDESYRRLFETAKADWARLFTAPDPSDASVIVRVSGDKILERAAVPGSARCADKVKRLTA